MLDRDVVNIIHPNDLLIYRQPPADELGRSIKRDRMPAGTS
jgi:hypothetical protein